MKHVTLGSLDVSRLGLGAMTMAGTYTSEGALDDSESIQTIHRALDLGVTHIDTAEIYGPFHSEEVVGQAVKGRRDEVVIATKFGLVSHRGGVNLGTVDSSAVSIRAAVEGSLRRLGTDHIDLYYQHRVDPNTPIEASRSWSSRRRCVGSSTPRMKVSSRALLWVLRRWARRTRGPEPRSRWSAPLDERP